MSSHPCSKIGALRIEFWFWCQLLKSIYYVLRFWFKVSTNGGRETKVVASNKARYELAPRQNIFAEGPSTEPWDMKPALCLGVRALIKNVIECEECWDGATLNYLVSAGVYATAWAYRDRLLGGKKTMTTAERKIVLIFLERWGTKVKDLHYARSIKEVAREVAGLSLQDMEYAMRREGGTTTRVREYVSFIYEYAAINPEDPTRSAATFMAMATTRELGYGQTGNTGSEVSTRVGARSWARVVPVIHSVVKRVYQKSERMVPVVPEVTAVPAFGAMLFDFRFSGHGRMGMTKSMFEAARNGADICGISRLDSLQFKAAVRAHNEGETEAVNRCISKLVPFGTLEDEDWYHVYLAVALSGKTTSIRNNCVFSRLSGEKLRVNLPRVYASEYIKMFPKQDLVGEYYLKGTGDGVYHIMSGRAASVRYAEGVIMGRTTDRWVKQLGTKFPACVRSSH